MPRLLDGLRLAARLILAGVFLFAGLVKAGAGQQFALTITPFTIIPPDWLPIIANLLPLLEVVAGILILIPRIHPAGSALILTLCLFYVGMLGWALANDIIVACSCFGQDETPSAGKMWLVLWRDVGFAALALFTVIRLPARSLDSARKTPASG